MREDVLAKSPLPASRLERRLFLFWGKITALSYRFDVGIDISIDAGRFG